MRIETKISIVAILLVTTATGCTAVDETVLGSVSPLNTGGLDAVADVTQSEKPLGNAISHQDDSLTLVSSQSIARRPLRTLESGDDLNAILDSTSGVVLLDFYADWCGPCKKQAAVLHQVEQFASEVNAQIIKINVEEHADLKKRFRVSSLPTLLAVKDGEVLDKSIGLTDRDEIKAMLR
jgi:thioredoxin 1